MTMAAGESDAGSFLDMDFPESPVVHSPLREEFTRSSISSESRKSTSTLGGFPVCVLIRPTCPVNIISFIINYILCQSKAAKRAASLPRLVPTNDSPIPPLPSPWSPNTPRDSIASGTSSIYPPSTISDFTVESPRTPSSLIGVRAPRVDIHTSEPDIYHDDDVSNRLRLLVSNNYFLPPAHTKPTPDVFSPPSAMLAPPKKASRSNSPAFLDLFRIGRKSKPTTPESASPQQCHNVNENFPPILRTTSDTPSSSGRPAYRAAPAPTHPRASDVGRVVVVREKLEDIVAASKRAEEQIRLAAAAAVSEGRRVPDVYLTGVIDPTDDVDIPPVPPGQLALRQSADAGQLAEHLPSPYSPGFSLSFASPEEEAWRKALLQQVVGHSLSNTPASTPGPTSATSMDKHARTDSEMTSTPICWAKPEEEEDNDSVSPTKSIPALTAPHTPLIAQPISPGLAMRADSPPSVPRSSLSPPPMASTSPPTVLAPGTRRSVTPLRAPSPAAPIMPLQPPPKRKNSMPSSPSFRPRTSERGSTEEQQPPLPVIHKTSSVLSSTTGEHRSESSLSSSSSIPEPRPSLTLSLFSARPEASRPAEARPSSDRGNEVDKSQQSTPSVYSSQDISHDSSIDNSKVNYAPESEGSASRPSVTITGAAEEGEEGSEISPALEGSFHSAMSERTISPSRSHSYGEDENYSPRMSSVTDAFGGGSSSGRSSSRLTMETPSPSPLRQFIGPGKDSDDEEDKGEEESLYAFPTTSSAHLGGNRHDLAQPRVSSESVMTFSPVGTPDNSSSISRRPQRPPSIITTMTIQERRASRAILSAPPIDMSTSFFDALQADPDALGEIDASDSDSESDGTEFGYDDGERSLQRPSAPWLHHRSSYMAPSSPTTASVIATPPRSSLMRLGNHSSPHLRGSPSGSGSSGNTTPIIPPVPPLRFAADDLDPKKPVVNIAHSPGFLASKKKGKGLAKTNERGSFEGMPVTSLDFYRYARSHQQQQQQLQQERHSDGDAVSALSVGSSVSLGTYNGASSSGRYLGAYKPPTIAGKSTVAEGSGISANTAAGARRELDETTKKLDGMVLQHIEAEKTRMKQIASSVAAQKKAGSSSRRRKM
jgi:hypothetical protein